MSKLELTEQIMKLICAGFDLELLSLELDIPVEQLKEYQKQLNSGKFTNQPEANQEPERKKERKKQNKLLREGATSTEEPTDAKPKDAKNYEVAIGQYKEEIARNPQHSLNKRNLLAFAYFKSGKIEEARDELMSLVEEYGSYMAYRQLVYLEKCQGNYEDAKLWATACLEQFPSDINIRYQLISVAIEEHNDEEAIKQLRAILKISPESKKGKEMLETFSAREDR